MAKRTEGLELDEKRDELDLTESVRRQYARRGRSQRPSIYFPEN